MILSAQGQYSTNARYYESPGEYVMFFKLHYNTPGIAYAVTTDNTIAGTGNTGAQGIPTEVVTPIPNEPMAGVCTGLHDGGMWSADSGRVFMGGLPTNCQLGNGLTTGPSTMYEILTDVNGNQFYGITAMTSGWGPVSGVPFYAAIESDTSTRVLVWGNGTNLGLGSCIKPTPLVLPGGRHPHKILAYKSSLHCIATDGTLWVIGGTDDYAANTGVNATPTTWTQVTLPGGQLASFIAKGNGFAYVISQTGHLIFFGEYGWLGENTNSNAFNPITTPTQVDSYYPSAIFPIDTMIAAHVGYAILNTSNGLFTGGSNEVGFCGTGPTINWPLYTTPNGTTPYNGSPPEPYNWFVGMGQYVSQCTQIAKGSPAVWNKLFGGPLYSLYWIAEDTAGNRYIAGRGKVIPDGMIWADSLGSRIAAAYHMGHNVMYFAKVLDYFSIISSIISSCPGCNTGFLTGTPCSYGTDAPSRPNTNLHCNLVVTPFAGGFSWSIATSTTDATHKIMPVNSYIVQSAGTSINLGVQAGQSGTVVGVPAGNYSLIDTMVDNSYDTVEGTASFTVPAATQTGFYCDTVAGSDANGCTFASPCASKAHTISLMSSGDTLYLKCNDVWHSATYPISGIVIMSYGTGNKPQNNGSITVSAWTSMGNGIYETYIPNDRATLNCVTLDAMLAGMGRYPDTGYVTFTGLTSSTLTSASISGFPYSYAGGTVCIRPEFSDLDTIHVSAQGSTTLTLASSPSILGGRGNGFFLMNHPNTLLTTLRVGSWYNNWAKDSLQMFFGSAGPSGHVVNIAVLDTGIYLTSNVTVQNVDFDYFNQYHIFGNNVSNVLFDSCKFLYAGNNVVIGNNVGHFTFRYDTMKYANNNFSFVTGSSSTYNVMQYCLLDSAGMTAGMGQTGAANGYSAWTWDYGFSTYQYNTFLNVGYNGLSFDGDSVNVSYNLFEFYCLVKSDGGGIYTWDPSFQSYTYGRNVYNNIAIFGGSAGSGIVFNQQDMSFSIYSDGHSSHGRFYNNTGAYNPSSAVLNHGSNNSYTYNNWFANGYAQFMASEASGIPLTNLTYTHNVHGYNFSGLSIAFTTPGTDLNTFCVACDTNYYLVPIGQTASMYTFSSTDAGTTRTLASWQTDLGYDIHSHYTQSAPLLLPYSIAGGAQSVYGYNQDAFGNIYNGSITLGAYSSSILQRISLPLVNSLQGGRIIWH